MNHLLPGMESNCALSTTVARTTTKRGAEGLLLLVLLVLLVLLLMLLLLLLSMLLSPGSPEL